MTSGHHKRPSLSRRSLMAGGVAAAGAGLIPAEAATRIVMNDASRLSPTPVAKHWITRTDNKGEFIEALRREILEARSEKRPVLVGAARHSMGGQSLPRDGSAITLACPPPVLDTSAGTFRVDAGARWSQVIAALDPAGFSPAVMQSNHDFGVASTFSVNAHGWPVPYGPFGSTVRSLRLMLADGSLVECSRTQNAELFSLAMGGYGLFGIIIDLEVEMAKNVLLQPKFEVMPPSDFSARFINAVGTDKSVLMAYGRLSVTRDRFFDEALLATYRAVPKQPAKLPAATSSSALTGFSNNIYRSQIGSETGKKLRWAAETSVSPRMSSGIATRNTLMNEPVSNLANLDRRRTDILHEYFIPADRLNEFLGSCRDIIPRAKAEFLNVTLRYLAADPVSVLAHSPGPRIALVMSFSQEITPEGEVDMIEATEKLIDAAISAGGAFYLPYRLHARRDQVKSAYPRAEFFAERKRHYDPGLVFRHAMWDMYFA